MVGVGTTDLDNSVQRIQLFSVYCQHILCLSGRGGLHGFNFSSNKDDFNFDLLCVKLELLKIHCLSCTDSCRQLFYGVYIVLLKTTYL